MFFGDVPSANVVQRSVVGLSHHPVDRLDVAVLGIRERIVDQRVQTGRHAERVGQHDRGFEVSQFPDLRVTGHFAVTVADADGCRQLVPENIAGMGNDGRDAVRTESPSISVVWPTRTPFTSVIALSGPVLKIPYSIP